MFTEAQAKALTICDACSDERVFSPADAVVRAGNEYAGYDDVHLCHACGDSEPWTRATKREIKQPAERQAWAEASMEERRAALAGHFEGFRASETL
jgi:hypothetical protein